MEQRTGSSSVAMESINMAGNGKKNQLTKQKTPNQPEIKTKDERVNTKFLDQVKQRSAPK